ncbi:unnamed protein product [Acanthoscelides obtectus]|uniref:Uncharacterized protein n=1 Tax=Acanthoscelides obtectus TaxID=200917 RepID=A0A9P0PJP9_ACAOB|nr:unnamed protein product [Acanthoscelides obtectus]CAK1651673.1 hypothetical protein AOBTE_LOCUS17386 [Acanthoscelides obtectus]
MRTGASSSDPESLAYAPIKPLRALLSFNTVPPEAAIIALLSLIDNFQRQWDVGSAFFVELAVKKLRQPSTDAHDKY